MASTLERKEKRLREDGFSPWLHKSTGKSVWARPNANHPRLMELAERVNRFERKSVDAEWFRLWHERAMV